MQANVLATLVDLHHQDPVWFMAFAGYFFIIPTQKQNRRLATTQNPSSLLYFLNQLFALPISFTIHVVFFFLVGFFLNRLFSLCFKCFGFFLCVCVPYYLHCITSCLASLTFSSTSNHFWVTLENWETRDLKGFSPEVWSWWWHSALTPSNGNILLEQFFCWSQDLTGLSWDSLQPVLQCFRKERFPGWLYPYSH